MRFLLVCVVMLAAASAHAKALEFPKAFRGLWSTEASPCVYIKLRGHPNHYEVWIRVSANKVTGHTTGRISRIVDPATVEIETDKGINRLTLRPDGFLEDRVAGAGDSRIYLRCPERR